ncbi:sodium-independent sulfate anion transporter-like [Plodia interpunctella]|uniref:sodium-independent sulfate anion transporter-like n=1 Tax=Plodia interpunctella TaxID=58824 RepID=UPI002367B913|nr:sodium-independent sulfate anion transporter-like [Plodia interpunctella]
MTISANILLRRRLKTCGQDLCSVKILKKRLPILEWLPKYSVSFLIQDLIAGVTVGLTAIPQGIAYAVVAGLPPAYGLYASLTAGVVYMVFGSCKSVTVGPTAIVSTLTGKYVSGYSPDFAVLAAFLTGIAQLVLGVLKLGFLVQFISMPVINGFTTASAMQIASSQLKPLLGLSGSSGHNFRLSMGNFFANFTTIQLWDSVFGLTTILILVFLKKAGVGCKRSDGVVKQMRWFVSLSRNAVVVIIGIAAAFIVKSQWDIEPAALIGDIGQGLPKFELPPFYTVVDGVPYNFVEMLEVLGAKSIVLPLVGILESVAIAKAFADGLQVDATQELIALGLCNVVGSFASSMPVTGSFTRTALNHASGVQTQAGGVVCVIIIITALTLLTSTFAYIPKATLAGLIMTAMFYMLHTDIVIRLWKYTKREFFLFIFTVIVCLFVGLEYGIVSGIVMEAMMLMYISARPRIDVDIKKDGNSELIVMSLTERLAYCAAEHTRKAIIDISFKTDKGTIVIVDGSNLRNMDITVADNLVSAAVDFEKSGRRILFSDFDPRLKDMCLDIDPNLGKNFVSSTNLNELSNVVHKEV